MIRKKSRLLLSPEGVETRCRILQTVRQWIPGRWDSDWERPTAVNDNIERRVDEACQSRDDVEWLGRWPVYSNPPSTEHCPRQPHYGLNPAMFSNNDSLFLVASITTDTNCYSFTYPRGMEGWVDLSTMSVNNLLKVITWKRSWWDSNPWPMSH